MTIGDRVRAERTALRFSQQDLADKVGISRPAITQIESGESKGLRPENLVAVADALHVLERWLVTGKGPKTAEEWFRKQLERRAKSGLLEKEFGDLFAKFEDDEEAEIRRIGHLYSGSDAAIKMAVKAILEREATHSDSGQVPDMEDLTPVPDLGHKIPSKRKS